MRKPRRDQKQRPKAYKLRYNPYDRSAGFSPLLDLPVDIGNQILSVMDENSLAQLAGTCNALQFQTECYRFRNVTVRSPAALQSLWLALNDPVVGKEGRSRAHRLRSLELTWLEKAAGSYSESLESVLSKVLDVVTNVEDLVLDIPLVTDLSLASLVRLQCLTLSTTAVAHVHSPLPTATCVTIRVRSDKLRGVYAQFAKTFGQTVKTLRVARLISVDFDEESPGYITAEMADAPALEFLEVRDTRSKWMVFPPRREAPEEWDFWPVPHPVFKHIQRSLPPTRPFEGVPNLRTIVWQPTWISAYRTERGRFKALAAYWMQRLDRGVDGFVTYICVSDTRGLVLDRGRECQKGSWRVCDALPMVEVDLDEWRLV